MLTTPMIILGLLALIALFISRALFNYRERDLQTEETKRLEDRLQFRRDRWTRWFRRDVPKQ